MDGKQSRRQLLVAAAAFGTVALGARLNPAQASPARWTTGPRPLQPGMTAAPTTPYLPYTPTSYFREPATGAPVDSQRTAAFLAFMRTAVDQRAFSWPRINGLGKNRWGTAYALGSSMDPIWRLTGSVPAKASLLKTQGFHAPDSLGASLTGTSDSPFCVVDRAFGYTVFGGAATANTGMHTINVKSAGLTYHDSNGLDGRNPASDEHANFTSRGRISDAMVIRRDLVDYAIATGSGLGHVLHLFLVETRTSDGFCNPMVGDESGKYGFGAEGDRIVVRPDVDLSKRGLTPFGLAVARTLQSHGCYFGDNSGSSSALKAQQAGVGSDPWAGLAGGATQDALKGLTWADFSVVQRGWTAGV